MSDSIYLHGSEDVRSAGNRMHEAAGQMNQAAANFQYALEQHQRFLDDWLIRFTDAVSMMCAATSKGEEGSGDG